MAASNKVIDLRRLLAERFPQTFEPGGDRLRTGLPVIDRAIGGLPKNAITELSSPNLSAGSALLIHALLVRAYRDGFFVALIDGSDSFDPQPAAHALRNLLWARCHHAAEAVQAADLLLRDGNFPLVVLDLVLNAGDELRKIPQTHWYRLQRLVEAAPTAFLVLTRRNMIGSAQLKLSLENGWRLSDLEQPGLSARLNIQVERVHGPREIMATAG
jgi:recA bacterial DNA recombination protein